MKLKDYKPKYKSLELMIDKGKFWKMITTAKVTNYEKAVKRYGELEIASIKNFDKTMITSIILKGRGY